MYTLRQKLWIDFVDIFFVIFSKTNQKLIMYSIIKLLSKKLIKFNDFKN